MLATGLPRGDAATMVLATQHLVGDLARPDISDDYLISFALNLAADGSCLVRRSTPTPTQGCHLQNLNAISKFDQPRRTREELGAKVCCDPKGKYVDAEVIDDDGELIDLLRGVELHLVTDDVIDTMTLGQ